jgi:hypothetical protein
MAKKKMFKFNVKNVKFSFATCGVFDAPADLAYASSLTLEADYNETKLYGDGEILGIIGDDKGKNGTLGVINIEDAYEIACGRAMQITEGLADSQQMESKEHAIYYEVDAIEDGAKVTIKVWVFGCITGKASESYAQTEDDPTVNSYEYPLTVLGTKLQDNLDAEDYKTANGNTVNVYRVIKYPEDTGYATFGDTVPSVTAVI